MRYVTGDLPEQRCAAQANCNVIVHGRTIDNTRKTVEFLREYDVETSVVSGDLGTENGVKSIIRGVEEKPGYINILYNNAAIMNKWIPAWEISNKTWQEM